MEVKDWLADAGLEKDALHIYAAVALQVVAAAVLRRPLSSLLPLALVLVAACINEALDIALGQEARIQPWQVAGALHDMVNTLVLPVILLLLVRHAPGLFGPRPASGAPATPAPAAESDAP